eukprot:TRINITY_DN10971_c0_g3_i4.p1 TRINITY_DN10971_c0_g3~~TRINITY_DN10971_c0_g3_i4.p1  ORF type:complete len:663 (+),score=72.08 TRINITY_DN10971_c0_g3_i4:87-2075(+)
MPPPGLWTGEHVPSVEDALDSESLLWHASQLLGGHPQGCMCHKQGPGARPLVANPDPALPRAAPRTPPQTEAPAQAAVAVKASPLSRQPHLRPGLQPQLRPGLLPAVPPPPQARPAPPSILPRCGHDGGRRRRGRSAGGTPLGCCTPLRRGPGGTGGGLFPTRRRQRDAVALGAAEGPEPGCAAVGPGPPGRLCGQDTQDDRRAQRRCALLEGIVKELTAQIECLQGEAQRAAQRARSSDELCVRLQGRLSELHDGLARRTAPQERLESPIKEQQADSSRTSEAPWQPAAGRLLPAGPQPRRKRLQRRILGGPVALGSAAPAARKPTLGAPAQQLPAAPSAAAVAAAAAAAATAASARAHLVSCAAAGAQGGGRDAVPTERCGAVGVVAGAVDQKPAADMVPPACAVAVPEPPPSVPGAAAPPPAAPAAAPGILAGLQGLPWAFWKGYKDGLAARREAHAAASAAQRGAQEGAHLASRRDAAPRRAADGAMTRGATAELPARAKQSEVARFLTSEVVVFRVAAHSPRAWAPVCRATASSVHWAMQHWVWAFQSEALYARALQGAWDLDSPYDVDIVSAISILRSLHYTLRRLVLDVDDDAQQAARSLLLYMISARDLLYQELRNELSLIQTTATVCLVRAETSVRVIEAVLGPEEVVQPWTS